MFNVILGSFGTSPIFRKNGLSWSKIELNLGLGLTSNIKFIWCVIFGSFSTLISKWSNSKTAALAAKLIKICDPGRLATRMRGNLTFNCIVQGPVIWGTCLNRACNSKRLRVRQNGLKFGIQKHLI